MQGMAQTQVFNHGQTDTPLPQREHADIRRRRWQSILEAKQKAIDTIHSAT